MTAAFEGTLSVTSEGDVIAARRRIREAAQALGFGLTDVTRIVTAASELTRNMYQHAGGGDIEWRRVDRAGQAGLELVFRDEGPGIADPAQAMQEGFTSGRGLGMGMPGSRRLMDELEVSSESGAGTTVTARKWLR